MNRKRKGKKKSGKVKKDRKNLKPYFIPENLPVLGLEGTIAKALAFAFRKRVKHQTERHMHFSFKAAQYGVVGGRMQHLVVRATRSGWMITDARWIKHPPHDVIDDAISILMSRELTLHRSKARQIVRKSIVESHLACKRQREVRPGRRPSHA